MKHVREHWRLWLLSGLSLCAVAAVALHAPIPQDPSYHHFADQRTYVRVPNFWNVVSNAPFILVGVAGLLTLAFRRSPGVLGALRPSFTTFFLAAVLVGLGSGYYHLQPTDATLVWDRLPMTLAFMAFVSIAIGEHIHVFVGRSVLHWLLAAGLVSVLWWRVGGDLRAYVLVQYLPVLLIPLVMVLFPSRLSPTWFVWGLLASYALAKALELNDRPIFGALGVSGHTLKHLAAALGMSLLVIAMQRRKENRSTGASNMPLQPTVTCPPMRPSGAWRSRASG